jgi:hypothetical protein
LIDSGIGRGLRETQSGGYQEKCESETQSSKRSGFISTHILKLH